MLVATGRTLDIRRIPGAAPDQRGYSPGARPEGRRAYSATNLRDDVLALADTAGAQRFDVVGHDWGGFVAWDLAARHADRVRSCTSLSTPHPRAIRDVALKSTQLMHLWYALGFQVPIVPELTLRSSDRHVVPGMPSTAAAWNPGRRPSTRHVSRIAMR